MLYASLILSALLLLCVNRVVARQQFVVPKTIALGFGFSVLPACACLAFPAVMVQAVALSLLLVVLVSPERGRRLYLPLSCIATVTSYGVLVNPAIEKRREEVRLRQEYPLEPLSDRLPKRTGIASPHADPKRLDGMESGLERAEYSEHAPYIPRSSELKRLHEQSVNSFVASAGFGVGRMGQFNRRPDAESLKPAEEPSIPQPDYLDPFTPPQGAMSADIEGWPSGKMLSFHDDAVIDFLNSRGFGYFKSRREVAGFRSHGMSKVPESNDAWKPARIELIGLLMHDAPVVYRSTNLPRMTELKSVPTRPLDEFETEGMEALRKGEDLYVRGAGPKARMIGSIRAAKQCLDCHDGQRGDLLGAFSYGFRRE